MSEPLPEMPSGAPLREMKVRVTDATLLALFEQRESLGFHSENSIASLAITAFADVPPEKFFEALAKVGTYHRVKRSTNPIASLAIAAFADVPPEKIMEAVAAVRAFRAVNPSKRGGSKR